VLARPARTAVAELAASEGGLRRSVLLYFLPHALRTFHQERALAITVCCLLVAMAGTFCN